MSTPSLIGTTLGKYQVQSEIGHGGMGTVFLGYDPQLDRHVAIKVLAPSLAGEQGFVDRFLRESRAAARLNHPAIVTVYDVGQQGPWLYFVMEYLQGQTLSRVIQLQGALPPKEAVTTLQALADALDYAHARGLVHRDIKPDNVIVRSNGRVAITDFGIARVTQESRVTAVGTVVGTPQYMSPEQALGQAVDARSDQYSLAVVAYQMLSGQVPFRAENTPAVLYKVAHEPPPSIREFQPGLPPAMEQVLTRALSKDPAARYPTAGAFINDLSQALSGQPSAQAAAAAPLGATVPQPPRPPEPAAGGFAAWPPPAGGGYTPPPAAGGGYTPPPAGHTPPPAGGGYTPPPAAGGYGAWPPPGAGYTPPPGAGYAPPPAPVYTPPPMAAAPYVPLPAAPPPQARQGGLPWAYLAIGGVVLLALLVLMIVPSAGPLHGLLPAAEPTVTPTAMPTATPSPLPSLTPTVASTATATAARTATPAPPTATPTRATNVEQTSTPTPIPTATRTPIPAPTNTPLPVPARPGLVVDFETDLVWRRGDQPYGTLALSTDRVYAGRYSGKLAYDFPAVTQNFVVLEARPVIGLSGQPTGIAAMVYGNGSGHFLNAWMLDAAGELRQYTFGRITHTGWLRMVAWFDERRGWPNGTVGGPDNGRLDFPASFDGFVLDGVPDGQASSGAIYLDEVLITQEPIPAASPTPPPATTKGAVLVGSIDGPQMGRLGGLLGLGLLLGLLLLADRPAVALRQWRRQRAGA